MRCHGPYRVHSRYGRNFNCCTALGKNFSVFTLSDPWDMSRSSGFAFWAMMDEISHLEDTAAL